MRPETPAERRTRQAGWASKSKFAGSAFRAALRENAGRDTDEELPRRLPPAGDGLLGVLEAEDLGQLKLDV